MDWEKLLTKYGEYGLWERIRKLKSFREYYRRWPYDDTTKVYQLHGGDYYDEMATQNLRNIEAEWDFEILISAWTERKQSIARYVVAGYKPRHIAALLGEPDTGAIRWVKWSLREKLKGK